jgi:hypothetical protein
VSALLVVLALVLTAATLLLGYSLCVMGSRKMPSPSYRPEGSLDMANPPSEDRK